MGHHCSRQYLDKPNFLEENTIYMEHRANHHDLVRGFTPPPSVTNIIKKQNKKSEAMLNTARVLAKKKKIAHVHACYECAC